ncbi:MAG: Acetyl-coenzyme A carboxylase carboxyl transferase subunit alpha [Firmicutes bacterium ADurb.Bin193]|nr:MAG: Acetyl-coenzyme A carboxylase carboxyl transferase subunit alpha [Firmicutes bacterium ADurb.Bin193]
MRSPYEKMQIAKNVSRPNFYSYVNAVFDDFTELHGDRLFGDDSAIAGGIARLGKIPVTVIGTVKGNTTNENIQRNFGMPNPEGYRKALRLMQQAVKFHRPVICLIDTPGAYPGVGAEQRGQGEAIAKNLMSMMSLKTPVISVITGEGGSGGALALAVANTVYMLENAVYSVISANGFASILWKDAKREKEAAELMKMTAQDLYAFKVVDKIIPEHPDGAHISPEITFTALKKELTKDIKKLTSMSEDDILTGRYEKFRSFGVFTKI